MTWTLVTLRTCRRLGVPRQVGAPVRSSVDLVVVVEAVDGQCGGGQSHAAVVATEAAVALACALDGAGADQFVDRASMVWR
jgi:hypothetical protein